MPAALVKSTATPLDLLALYTVDVNGVLADAYRVECLVYNDTTTMGGAVLLSDGGGRINVTSHVVGHFATGCYGVIDPATGLAWTPAAAVKRGRVVWYVVQAEGDLERVVERPFEVLDTGMAGRPQQVLALVQDVRDAGLSASVTDAKAHAALLLARDMIERYCRQRLRTVRETRRLRGSNSTMLHLPEPLVGLARVVIADTTITTVVDLTTLRVWSADDDRHNPRIEVAMDRITVYTSTGTTLFVSYYPQLVTGVWGYVDADTLDTPRIVQDASARLALLLLDKDAAADALQGPVSSRTVDRRTESYTGLGLARGRTASLSLLRDPAVRDALDLYRAPIMVGCP